MPLIILRQDLSQENVNALFPVVRSYNLSTGRANAIVCSEVDYSHPTYLVVIAKPTKEDGADVELHIPHMIVLTVVGSKSSPPVGFLWDA